MLYLVFFCSLLFGVSGGFLVVFWWFFAFGFRIILIPDKWVLGVAGGTGGRWGVRLFYIVQIMAS